MRVRQRVQAYFCLLIRTHTAAYDPLREVIPGPANRGPFILEMTMPRYLIERTVPGANLLTVDELRDIATKSNSVVAGLGEQYIWEHTYVAGDKLLCVHEAANPEIIRRHGAEGGFPIDSITEISSMIGPHTGAVRG